MAKKNRKKKGKDGNAGGAFGNKKSRPSTVPEIVTDPSIDQYRNEAREQERISEIVQSEIASRSFESDEETEEFVQENFGSSSIEEIFEKYGRYEDSPRGRATKILEEAETAPSPKLFRQKVSEALEEDPESLEALLLLAKTESTLDAELAQTEKAITKGKEIFNDNIEQLNKGALDQDGIGSLKEARPLLFAMNHLAELHETIHGDFLKAIEVYQEILALNPADLLRIGGDITRLYLLMGDIESTDSFIESYTGMEPDEVLLFSKLFLEFERSFRSAIEQGWQMDWKEPRFLDAPGEGFKAASKIVQEVVKKYPWAPAMLADIRCAEIVPPQVTFPFTPNEVLKLAQKYVSLWTLKNPFSGMWFLHESSEYFDEINVELLQQYHDEFSQICRQLQRIKLNKIMRTDLDEYPANKMMTEISTRYQKGLIV